MTKDERESVYKTAVEKWGINAQLEMAQEEATELALAVRKFLRKKDQATFNHLIEEIADVENMIAQVEFMYPEFPVRESIELQKDFKLNRLIGRIAANSFE